MTAAHRRNFTIRKGILSWLIIKVEILTLVSKIMRAAGLKEDWASFDDKYNIFVSSKSFTSYLGSEELRSFKITDYIHPDDVESFKKFVEDKSFTGGEEVFRLKKKNNGWHYNVVRIHTEKGMVENRRNIGVEIIDINESVGDYETAMDSLSRVRLLMSLTDEFAFIY